MTKHGCPDQLFKLVIFLASSQSRKNWRTKRARGLRFRSFYIAKLVRKQHLLDKLRKVARMLRRSAAKVPAAIALVLVFTMVLWRIKQTTPTTHELIHRPRHT